MDEIGLVRKLYGEVSPAPRVEAKIRSRLDGRGAPVGRQVQIRRSLLAAGIVAIIAAAAGLVFTGGGRARPLVAQAVPTAPSARMILAAAATKVQRTPSSGAYWHVRSQTGLRQPVDGKGYLVEQRSSEETWSARTSNGPTWRVFQDLSTGPATATDMAAWRKDGSPASWRVGVIPTDPDRTCEKYPHKCTGTVVRSRPQAGAPRAYRDSYAAWSVANRSMTAADLQRLPSDPEQLKARLGQLVRDSYAGTTFVGTPAEQAAQEQADMLSEAVGIVMGLPVTAQVRAAAYRMIADQPAVTAIGTVRDPLGRSGQAVAMPHGGSSGLQDWLVIDPRTGLPLASEIVVVDGPRAGQAMDYQAVQDIGWTDQRPTLPKTANG